MLIEYVKNGRRQNVRPAVAKLLVRRKLAVIVEDQAGDAVEEKAPQAQAPRTYDTRMLQSNTTEAAPYGYKADGTPRKRPAPAPRASKAQD